MAMCALLAGLAGLAGSYLSGRPPRHPGGPSTSIGRTQKAPQNVKLLAHSASQPASEQPWRVSRNLDCMKEALVRGDSVLDGDRSAH
ncbi:uncharacterized protein BO95DRAFT_25014 [Aspergillus brunneoviolaceus CBS 621.78]|uniref:Uncharacterized protein n=1 Tax=Aspergillus brunneoviolaceus CBS 621.78 TaxID=1450534 RepID=A0ACD1GIJ5_9EURO|nr:hypothetical protein BO95DRAFT_25014 [Aspergillus brunneoviolaceus CBS 621.78]RAH49037.1 hypothetical protein BO95DRAFT_25014 [Aspergillus brunneoviolaceus CBS 621.78]